MAGSTPSSQQRVGSRVGRVRMDLDGHAMMRMNSVRVEALMWPCFSLILLICFSQDLDTQDLDTPKMVKPKLFVEWWKNPEFLEFLDLNDDQTTLLNTQMDRFYVEYQVLWTKVRTGRKTVQDIYWNAGIDRDTAIEKFEAEFGKPRAELERLKCSTRLFVRDFLAESGNLEKVRDQYPRFFQVRWFARPRIPVIEGVIQEEE